MIEAYLRDAATGNYLYNSIVPFQDKPAKGEFLWIQNIAYLVIVVSHTWKLDGVPMLVIDVANASVQQSLAPHGTGQPSVG